MSFSMVFSSSIHVVENDRISAFLKAEVVAHACHPSPLGAQGGQITWDQKFETSLANMVKPCLY